MKKIAMSIVLVVIIVLLSIIALQGTAQFRSITLSQGHKLTFLDWGYYSHKKGDTIRIYRVTSNYYVTNCAPYGSQTEWRPYAGYARRDTNWLDESDLVERDIPQAETEVYSREQIEEMPYRKIGNVATDTMVRIVVVQDRAFW